MPEISVVMPVYNKARYLAGTLESVMAQTFPDFELIVIDDGSTDGSPEIARRFAQGDGRIRLVNLPGGGVSRARNAGLNRALGAYVTFVDADDRLKPGFLEHMYTLLRAQRVDMVISGMVKMHGDQPCGEVVSRHPGRFFMDALLRDFASEQRRCGLYGCCAAKLFPRALCRDLRFDERLTLAEDFDFYLRLYERVDAVYLDDQMNYIYLQETENSSVQLRDDRIDYLAQLHLSLRYRRFLAGRGRYTGDNRAIVDARIANYLFLTLVYCPRASFSARFRALREIDRRERLTHTAQGLRKRMTLTLFELNMPHVLLGCLLLARGLKGAMRRGSTWQG